MEGATAAAPPSSAETEQKVTALELFFDLVFVFAITQVTTLMAERPDWTGLAQGLLVLAILWWAWVGYSWLTNFTDAEEGGTRLSMFAVMAAMLVASLALPGAFGDDAVLFAGAYAVVRLLHIVIYARAAGGSDVLDAVRRLGVSTALGAGLLVVGAVLGGTAQAIVWTVAILLDVAGPLVIDPAGWRLSAGHFAERHGLIVIVALGESIVVIGAAREGGLGAGEVVAATLGITLAATQWWAYFDVVALVAERRLRSLSGRERNRMARDSFSYLHFLLVAGIVLTALGVKKTLGHVDEPLKQVHAFALCGGVATYLLGHVLFRRRNIGSWNRQRLVVGAALLAFSVVADEVDALVALAVTTGAMVALIAYEAIRFAEVRDRVRHREGIVVSGAQ